MPEFYDMIESYVICDCGAVTIFFTDGRSVSCKRRNLKRFFPGLDLRRVKKEQNCFACDHCVSHYGLDLCACGSGESPDKCKNGYEECGKPMQTVEGGTHISHTSWLR